MVTAELKSATDAVLQDALSIADPMILRGLLYHATADETLARFETIEVPAGFVTARILKSPKDAEYVREQAFRLLKNYRDGYREPPGPHSVPNNQLQRALSLAAGEEVPREELDLHLDVILALDAEPKGWGEPPSAGNVAEFQVIVIGAGFAGISAAIQLKKSGIPFKLLDRNGGVGGTWYNNRYPGARVDWPSRLYSHSWGVGYPFEYSYSPRANVEAYLRWCVKRYDLEPHMQFDTQVTSMTWNDDRGSWELTAQRPDGTVVQESARAVISAIGLLDRPSIPSLQGRERFRGEIVHSSLFRENTDLTGKSVAVIGTGCTGMQIAPDLAPLARHVTVFQRTPGWVFPVAGYRDPLPEVQKWLDRNVPYYTNWTRFRLAWVLGDSGLLKIHEIDPAWDQPVSVNATSHAVMLGALEHLQKNLGDNPELLARCTPNFPVFGTRPVVDNGWFEALKRENFTLVTEGVKQVTESGVISDSGHRYDFDMIVLATGFKTNDYFFPIDVRGRKGRGVNDIWKKDGARAYWGVTVPELPNLFVMYGPNANPRNLGPVQYGEWAMQYFLQAFKVMIEKGLKSIEVRQDVHDSHNRLLDERLGKMVNTGSKVKSYYNNEFGRSAVNSPWRSTEVWRALSRFDPQDYVLQPFERS